jgi:MFS family permease
MPHTHTAIGAVTVFTGIVGAATGGWLADYLTPAATCEHNVNRSNTILAAMVLVCCLLSLPLASISFISTDPIVFFILTFLGEFLFFAATAPINGLGLSVVPKNMRSFAMTCQIFTIHLLGDFPSPMVVGLIADHYSIRMGMLFVCLWTIWAVLFGGICLFVCWRYQKRREREATGRGAEVLIEMQQQQQDSNDNPHDDEQDEEEQFTLSFNDG